MLPRPRTLRPIAFLLTAAAVCSLTAPVAAQSTTRVSVDSWGAEGNAHCESPAISADGRYVVFSTSAHLVPGLTLTHELIYLHDRQTAETSLVSVNSLGQPASSACTSPSVSGDGRFVVFSSAAINLEGSSGGIVHIYLHDRQAGTTTRLSVNGAGVSGDDYSFVAEISADGRTVVFQSAASNLVANDTNGAYDLFVRDLQTGSLSRVSVDSNGGQADDGSVHPSISADGRHVAFQSYATNLVPGDTNLRTDVFVHDRQTGLTTRASVFSNGQQSSIPSFNPAISGDGRCVAFDADNDVYLHDRITGQTTLESRDSAGVPGNGSSNSPSLSRTGRYLAFASRATNLVTGDANGEWDVFLRDRNTGEVVLVSVSTAGVQSNSPGLEPDVSGDSGAVTFLSHADNLVSGDNNDRIDIFAFNRLRVPRLTRSGWCDGIVDLSIADATPAGQIAVLYGPPGQFTRLAGPCSGLELNLSTPHLATLLTADAGGFAGYSFFAPANASGLDVQVVDLATCAASGTASIEPRVFRLSKSGAYCSSGFAITLSVTEAIPSSTVALLHGSAGSYLKSAGACAGLTINLSAPTLLTTLTMNSAGSGQYHFTPPPWLCGLSVQGVELGACVLSNVVIL